MNKTLRKSQIISRRLEAKEWQQAFESLSFDQQRTLCAIGDKEVSLAILHTLTFMPKETQQRTLQKLRERRIVSRVRIGVYAIENPEFAAFCVEQAEQILRLSSEEITEWSQEIIYRAATDLVTPLAQGKYLHSKNPQDLIEHLQKIWYESFLDATKDTANPQITKNPH